MIPADSNREQLAEELVLAAAAEFDRQGIRVCASYHSPDWIVDRMRQAGITCGLYTWDLNAAVHRLRKAGKLVSVMVGRYEHRQPRYALKPAQVIAQVSDKSAENLEQVQ